MSDDDYDEDDYLEYEDFPFNDAEDLAAHTVQSPVFVNYDPAWETASFASDWDYYSDEYWEQEPSKKRRKIGDSIESAKIIKESESTKKRRKKKKPNGIPHLSLGEPSLAGSTVVWKSREETLKSSQGPVIKDGQGGKVSLLKDWRERFKTPTMAGFKAGQRKGSHRNVAEDPGDLSPEVCLEDILPAPPTTLAEMKDLRSRSCDNIVSLREPTFETNAFSLFDEDLDSDEDASELKDVSDSKDNKRTLDGELGSPDTVDVPSPKRKRGQPRKQNRLSFDRSERGDGLEAHTETAMANGKRKIDRECSPSDDTDQVISQGSKKGRAKEQTTSTSVANGHLKPAKTPPQVVKRPRGRPKKQKISPHGDQVPNGGLQTRPALAEDEEPTNLAHKGPTRPETSNKSASVRGKRKVSDSEDELANPPTKRQVRDIQSVVVSNTEAPIARRSTRRK